MKPRDLTDKRLRDLAEAAAGTAPCSIFAADLRALIAARALLVDIRTEADPFRQGRRADLAARAVAAKTSAAKVRIDPADLRGLLAMRAELIERQQEQARLAEAAGDEEAQAMHAAGAREIMARAGVGRRAILVGPTHGATKPNVRTYGFDLAHLADFLGMHPENVRQAVRARELVPTDLASIHAFKLALDARRAKKGKP
jgi:hypothetical protein